MRIISTLFSIFAHVPIHWWLSPFYLFYYLYLLIVNSLGVEYIFLMSRVVCIITLLTLLVAMASSQTQCSLHCTQCQTSISCSQCQLGFFLVNRTFCAPCPTGCTNCSIGANNLPICYSCAAPAQLDQTVGRCYLCNPMCLSCANNENNCVTCRDGQTL